MHNLQPAIRSTCVTTLKGSVSDLKNRLFCTDPTRKRKTPLPGEGGVSGRNMPQSREWGPDPRAKVLWQLVEDAQRGALCTLHDDRRGSAR